MPGSVQSTERHRFPEILPHLFIISPGLWLLFFCLQVLAHPASTSTSGPLIYRRPPAKLLSRVHALERSPTLDLESSESESESSRKIVSLPPRGADKPLHDPSILGATARLQSICDLELYQNHGAKIYEALGKGEDTTAMELALIQVLKNDKSGYNRSHSCFGYSAIQNPGSESTKPGGSTKPGSENEAFGSILRFYKCDEVKKVCLCYDEPPLVHVPDIHVPTGCRLADSKFGDKCDLATYQTAFSRVYEDNFKKIKAAANEDEHEAAFDKLHADRGKYFLLNDLHFAQMQSVCEAANFNLECKKQGSTSTCQCRNSPPNFKYKLKSGKCEGLPGSWCFPQDFQTQGVCQSGLKCLQVFKDYHRLAACGGPGDWCRAKDKTGAKCAFNRGSADLLDGWPGWPLTFLRSSRGHPLFFVMITSLVQFF